MVLATAVAGIVAPEAFSAGATAVYNVFTGGFGWLYPLVMTCFVLFAVWIGFFSKYGKMRLGPDDSVPAYSDKAWFAMLFSAGMGVGLVFWCVAEPLSHFAAPIGGIEAGSDAARQFAFVKAFLHWGLHPWACYTVMALCIAYMRYRKEQPTLISSLLVPLVGEKGANGLVGKTVDVLALLATAGGVCTTVGLGVMQIDSGMNYLLGVPQSTGLVVGTVVVLTAIYVATAVAGVEKGSAFISNMNIYIACAIAIICFFICGPVPVFRNFLEGLGDYLQGFVGNSLAMGAFGDQQWYGSWTIYYWAWWIAWAPFTGAFIARISRGRTIRQFVTGVLFLPAIVSMFWFAIFGTMGASLGLGFAQEAIKSAPTAFFMTISQYPLGRIISFAMLILCVTFFCASATSACTSLGMYSEGGTLNPSNKSKVVWGVLVAFLALSVMLSSVNGLDMLKTLSIVAGFPFALVGVLAIVSVIRALKGENPRKIDEAFEETAQPGYEEPVSSKG